MEGLQSKIDDLSEKLKNALAAQKIGIEEHMRVQMLMRNEYSALESKLDSCRNECESLQVCCADSKDSLLFTQNELQLSNKKCTHLLNELSILKDQNSMISLHRDELLLAIDEKERLRSIQEKQFESLGREFVKLKQFCDEERKSFTCQIEQKEAENQGTLEKVLHLQSKLNAQSATQQELNDLLAGLRDELVQCRSEIETERDSNKLLQEQLKQSDKGMLEAKESIFCLEDQLRSFASAAQDSSQIHQISLQKMNDQYSLLKQDLDQKSCLVETMHNQMEDLKKEHFRRCNEDKLHLESVQRKWMQYNSDIAAKLDHFTLIHQSYVKDFEDSINCKLSVCQDRLLSVTRLLLDHTHQLLLRANAATEALENQKKTNAELALLLSKELDQKNNFVRECEIKEGRIKAFQHQIQDLEDNFEEIQLQKQSLIGEVAELRLECSEAKSSLSEVRAIVESESEHRLLYEAKNSALSSELEKERLAEQSLKEEFDLKIQCEENANRELRTQLSQERASNKKLKEHLIRLENEGHALREKISLEASANQTLRRDLQTAVEDKRTAVVVAEREYARELARMDSRTTQLQCDLESAQDLSHDLNIQLEGFADRTNKLESELDALRFDSSHQKSLCDSLQQQLSLKSSEIELLKRELAEANRRFHVESESFESEMERMRKRNQVLLDTLNQLSNSNSAAPEKSREIEAMNPSLVAREELGWMSPQLKAASLSGEEVSLSRRQLNQARGVSAPPSTSMTSIQRDSHDFIRRSSESSQCQSDDGSEAEFIRESSEDLIRNIRQHIESNDMSGIRQRSRDRSDGYSDHIRLRARTAPPLRGLPTEPPSCQDNDLESDLDDVSAFESNSSVSQLRRGGVYQGPEISESDTYTTKNSTSSDVAIDKIQMAINLRKKQAALSKSQRTKARIRREEREDDISSIIRFSQEVGSRSDFDGSRDVLIESSNGVSEISANFALATELKSPVRTSRVSTPPTTFTRKLRNSVEDGEHHWIAFSPQSDSRKTSLKSKLSPKP